MLDSLKKIGLSDTKHHLKFHISSCSASRSSHSRKDTSHHQDVSISNFVTSNQTCIRNQTTHKKESTLDLLVYLLQKQQSRACSAKNHDRNPYRFICLEESCKGKIGCSYCFLEQHKLHPKTDSKAVLCNLIDLQQKTWKSKQQNKEKLILQKKQIIKQLSQIIDSIKEKFNNELNFLKTKIEQTISKQIAIKLEEVQTSYQSYSKPQTFQFNETSPNLLEDTQKNQQKSSETNKDISISQILKLFNSTTADKNKFKTEASRYTSCTKETKQNLTLKLSCHDQQELLSKILKLNLHQAEDYLRQQESEIQACIAHQKVYEDFFKELKDSLSQFFVTFKCAIPCCNSIQRCRAQPQILRPFIY